VSGILFFLGLAALLTLEEAGVFLLPGDISLVAAGVYAAQGGPFIAVSWLVASVGMIAGASVLFYGVRRSSHSRRFLPTRIRDLVHRHGVWGVAAARLVPGFRNATVLAAGAAQLPWRTFLSGLVPATFIWSAALLLVGWFGGHAILSLLGAVTGSPALKVLSLSLLLAAVFFAAVRRHAASPSSYSRHT
jgi:membrane-associated protein